MNELGVLVERRLKAKGSTLAQILQRSDIDADTAFGLFGPAQLAQMPDRATIAALAGALDIPYRDVVLAAAAACGVSTTPAGGRDTGLSRASHEDLLREMRRRLVGNRQPGDASRRMAHLAMAGRALMLEDVG
jgi:hypothetical protein